jgi:hypothetical protein
MCMARASGRLAGVAPSQLLCLFHDIKDNFRLDLLMETVRIAVNNLPSFYRRCSYSLVWQNIKKTSRKCDTPPYTVHKRGCSEMKVYIGTLLNSATIQL